MTPQSEIRVLKRTLHVALMDLEETQQDLRALSQIIVKQKRQVLETRMNLKILNAAGDALFNIMANEKLANSMPSKIRDKIDRWYELTLKAAGKDS